MDQIPEQGLILKPRNVYFYKKNVHNVLLILWGVEILIELLETRDRRFYLDGNLETLFDLS